MVKYDPLVLRTQLPAGALAFARRLVLCRQSR
jgi:hypothetical protein